ncbi:MAG: hypothetical protein RR385_05375 [Clostridiales bacterium]
MLGFLAFWLFGFLAFWLFGFLAFWIALVCVGSLIYFGLRWFSLACNYLLWLALIRFGFRWLALACFGLPWFFLVCLGLPWFIFPCFCRLWLFGSLALWIPSFIGFVNLLGLWVCGFVGLWVCGFIRSSCSLGVNIKKSSYRIVSVTTLLNKLIKLCL